MLHLRTSVALACLVLLTLAGCGRVASDVMAQNDTAAQVAQATPKAQEKRSDTDSDEVPKNPLFRSLFDAVDEVDDIEQSERDDARQTLRDADRIFRDVKAQNLKALRQAARQIRVRKCDAPNVVLILADELGYADLGSYGQEKIRTPNLDRLAAEGMRFTSFYAGSALGGASRCALMTGLHTGHGRVRGDRTVALLPEDPTLGDVLWNAGYATNFVGTWGLGDAGTTGTPNKQGFEHWFGSLNREHAADPYPESLWRNESQITLQGNLRGETGQHAHDLITDEALALLDPAKHDYKPFLLCVAYTLAHADSAVADPGPYADENWPEAEKAKAAMITRMDSDVGKILTRLDQLGIDRDTVVLFTSDHGPNREGGSYPAFFNSTGSFRGGKAELYEGGIRVPMIVRWPAAIRTGTVSDAAWASWDLLPTVADMVAAVSRPERIDGISMLPRLLGREQEGHEYLYWELHDGTFSQAIRMGHWKAVRSGPGRELELYDLSSDPGERHNVASDHAELVAKIEDLLANARTDSAEWPIPVSGR